MLKANVGGTLSQVRTANMQSSLSLPNGYTMLHAACHAGNAKVVKYLLLRCRRCRLRCLTAGNGSSLRDNPGVSGTWMRWTCRAGWRWSGDCCSCGGFPR
jgi:hypothetical protein